VPITAWQYNTDADHTRVVNWIKADPGKIIEFGGASSRYFGKLKIDHCVDIQAPWSPETAVTHEITNLNDGYCFDCPDGKRPYKWAICTHTLEDLHWPVPLLETLSVVAEKGYLAFPSAYIEMTSWGGSLGFQHHRWIYTVDDRVAARPVLVCWPKVTLLCADEFKDARTRTAAKGTRKNQMELEVWYEGDLPYRVVEIAEDREKVLANYRSLVQGRCGGV
jgi:hypothetical protein